MEFRAELKRIITELKRARAKLRYIRAELDFNDNLYSGFRLNLSFFKEFYGDFLSLNRDYYFSLIDKG